MARIATLHQQREVETGRPAADADDANGMLPRESTIGRHLTNRGEPRQRAMTARYRNDNHPAFPIERAFADARARDRDRPGRALLTRKERHP
jgi:hypothetical protein